MHYFKYYRKYGKKVVGLVGYLCVLQKFILYFVGFRLLMAENLSNLNQITLFPSNVGLNQK